MIRNHKLSFDFDISETFREKIKAKKNKNDAHIDKEKVQDIIDKKDKIAQIHNSAEGLFSISTGDRKYSVSYDELVLIIRESPHLFYSKKNNMFLNLKLIRVIEKKNDENVFIYYSDNNELNFVETKYDDVKEFFELITEDEFSNIDPEDFEYFDEKHFKIQVKKYIRKNLFEQEYKNLELNNKLSITTIFSASLFYLIPFIPFVGFTKYSSIIFPITTILIGLLLYQRSNNKKRLVELK